MLQPQRGTLGVDEIILTRAVSGTLGTARRDFSAQLDPYATRIGWWCPTGRGYGAIRHADRHFPDNFYEREARDMAALTRALDLREMTVFGWSEGAAVGRWLATVEPTRVKAVVVWGDQRARSLAERAQRAAPDTPQVVDTLGWILLKTGSPREALEHLRKASEAAPADALIRYHYAAALAANDRKDEAIAVLDAVLADDKMFADRAAAETLRRELKGGA